MSAAGEITVVAPEPADMQRDVEVPTATPLLAPRHHEMEVQCGPCDRIQVYARGRLEYVCCHLHDLRYHLVDDCCKDFSNTSETYTWCLCSCVFFFFCHTLGEIFLELFCLSRFLPCLEATTPDKLEPKNRTQKLFAFLAKNFARFWVVTLTALFVQWVLFRPIDVKPHLGTSSIHEFDLHQADAYHLRFNLTAYLLFKNRHDIYNITYGNLAVSVLYAGEKLGPVDDELPSFKQAPHGITVTRLVLVGQLRNASSAVSEMFYGDRDKGLFEMVVRIRVTLAYKYWPHKEDYFTIYDCPLSSPFPQTGGEHALSSPAWCKTKTNDVI